MKNIAKIGLSLALLLGLASCGSKDADTNKSSTSTSTSTSEETSSSKEANKDGGQTIKLGVVESNNDVWEDVAKRYKEATGNTIEIVTFTDYNQPNEALESGDIDINSYQHKKFLNNYNETNGTDIVEIGDTVLQPLGIYSSKIKSLDEIKDGDTVAIPDDSSNGARALFLLQAAGLIKVNGDPGDLVTVDDITENPKNLEITELEASQTARSLDDVTIAVVNSDFAVDAGIIPTKDALYLEDADSDDVKIYVNVVAARKEDKDNKVYKDIVENYYQTDATKEVIKESTKGSFIPAWN